MGLGEGEAFHYALYVITRLYITMVLLLTFHHLAKESPTICRIFTVEAVVMLDGLFGLAMLLQLQGPQRTVRVHLPPPAAWRERA